MACSCLTRNHLQVLNALRYRFHICTMQGTRICCAVQNQFSGQPCLQTRFYNKTNILGNYLDILYQRPKLCSINNNHNSGCYSVRGYSTDDFDSNRPSPSAEMHPFKRTWTVLRDDFKRTFWPMDHTDNASKVDVFDIYSRDCPRHCDVVVIGGGLMGSSVAYWLKKRALDGLSVMVIEKDASYASASSVLSAGGLRQQFSIKENVEMSLFGADFIRGAQEELSVPNKDVDVQFNPQGYLFLSSEEGAEMLQKNARLQTSLGAKVEILLPRKIKERFPWMNVDDVGLGCLGLANEGWLDPWSLLQGFRNKSQYLGAEYVSGEVVDFLFQRMNNMAVPPFKLGEFEKLDQVLVRNSEGKEIAIKFAICIIAAGAQSGRIASKARIGTGSGVMGIPLMIEPRKRFVFCFHAPKGPGLETPFVVDYSGTYFRREGLGGNYICGRSPPPEDDQLCDDLDVDHSYFESHVWPNLALRVPNFEELKVKSAWAGFYEYNTFDQNAVLGPHPVYMNLFFATGFSGHGVQHSPAIGRAITELILDGDYETIDLTGFGFQRYMADSPLYETGIV